MFLRYFLCYSTDMLTFWLSMLLLSFLIFMSNVTIINVLTRSLYLLFSKQELLKQNVLEPLFKIQNCHQVPII